ETPLARRPKDHRNSAKVTLRRAIGLVAKLHSANGPGVIAVPKTIHDDVSVIDRTAESEPADPESRFGAASLREDIRLRGRVLGATLRRQEGDAMFDVVERIRRTAIRFRRDGDHDAREELAKVVEGLEIEAAISVVRAFTYFSHLANIAE